jgi:Xaa-Pro dipeptidase
MSARINKLNAIAEDKQLDAFLITSPANLKYLSGFFFYFEYGTSPFQLLPAALFVVTQKSAELVIADNELQQSSNVYPNITITEYKTYVYETPLDFTNQFLRKLNELVRKDFAGISIRIGIEENSLPITIAQFLSGSFPKLEFVDVSPDIAQLRIIKDNDEVELIRKAAALSDIGQYSLLKHARPGITELELFNLIRNDIEATAGTRVPFMVDLISGASTSSAGGMPTGKTIKSGDLIISDLVPCLNGYWGDSCNTIIVGESNNTFNENFCRVKEALQIGINAIRPGVEAKEIDRVMREHVGNFFHHGGHGVGVLYHEEPRIVPYNQIRLQPNMVIALEPGIYEKDFGIRLEHLVVVTETGCEILTKFEHQLEL